MSASEEQIPVLFLEPRRLHALGAGAEHAHLSRPLACRALAGGELTAELLSRTGWRHVHDGGNPILIGELAVEIANAIPGIPPATYPLASARGHEQPDAGWKAIHSLLEETLTEIGAGSSSLMLLLPTKDTSGKHLGLRSIPEFLMLGKFTGLRVESVTQPLLDGETCNNLLRWGWVFEESGTSIAALWRNELCEEHLDAGLVWSEEISARAQGEMEFGARRETGEDSPAERAMEVALQSLVEQVLARTLALHREAWRADGRPNLEIRMALPAEKIPLIERVLPRMLRRHQVRGAGVEILSITQLLELARNPQPRPRPPALALSSRPQAIRPRGHAARVSPR